LKSKSHAEFLLRANTVGLGKGAGSGLILDDSTDMAAVGVGTDGRSRLNQSCERLVRGDKGTSGPG
jgi:hypothetical protein